MPLFFDRLFRPRDHDGVKSQEKSGERRGQGPEDKKGIQNADSTGLFVTTCDSSILFGNINGTDCQLFVTDCNIDEDVVTAHQAVLDRPQVLYAASHGHLPGSCDVEVHSFGADEWLAEAMVWKRTCPCGSL